MFFLLAAAALAAPNAADSADATAEDTIVVTGSVYRGEVASGGARVDADVKDLPLSISVVTEALIDDRQVRNLRDLAENVAGVHSRASGSGAFAIDFTVRGLQGGSTALNGYRVDNFAAGFDPQTVERVEFLKGPASVLYGASGALSGLVNVVTKTPQSDNFLTVDATGGAPLYGRVGIDSNAALTDTLDARLNMALTYEKQPNAFRDVNAQLAMPSLRWRPAPGVSLLIEGTYFHVVQPSRGTVNSPPDERFAELPRDFVTGERYDRDENTGTNLRVEGNWEVAPGLTLHQGVNYQDYRTNSIDVRLDQLIAPDIVSRYASRGDGYSRYLVSQSEVRATFNLLGMSHKLLAGFEYSNAQSGGFCCDSADIAPLDLRNPVYGAPQPVLGLTQLFINTTRTKAAYIQDFVEAGQVKLLAGVRYDDTTQTSGFCDIATPGCSSGDPVARNLGAARETALSPRLGLVWQPNDRTTLFASWSRSFNPNPFLDRNNRLLPPERGIQYEAGVRQDLLSPGRLLLSLTVFDLTRRNIGDCDPLFPDCSRFVAIGEQRVRGAEAELSGKPAPWLDLIATYAYLDGKVTKNDPAINGIAVGSALPEATPHSASLFAKLGLDPLGVPDVALSAGVYYVSSRPGRDFFGAFSTGPFARPLRRLPASTRVDLAAYWTLSPRWKLQANLTNAFDVKVFEPVNVGFNLSQRRRFTAGVTASF